MKRIDERMPDQLRPVKITRNYLRHGEGAVLIEVEHTKVICTATIEERVPPFRRDSGAGWLTAEYSMLPRSSHSRISRETRGPKGRTQEIQRLIGRSLRAAVDMKALGPRTILLDCDVIQADGGTRTASITGAWVALHDSFKYLEKQGVLKKWPMKHAVAAVSVGIVKGVPVLDLNYSEDFAAEVDMNVVMTGDGKYIEVQGTAEEEPFASEALDELLRLAKKGCAELVAVQEAALNGSAS